MAREIPASDPTVDAAPLDVSQLVVDRAHDLITMFAPDGTISFASPSWRALGHEPAALIGTSMLALMHPEDVDAAGAAIGDVAGGVDREDVPLRVRRADGTYAEVESDGTLLLDGAGTPVGILGTGRVLTDRIQLRARLAELGAVNRLADAVARVSTLDELLDEAVDAILDGVGASRASVLLKDDEGVMRFRAWRGLSDEYRRATDGHSPWPADATDPEPVLVEDALAGGFSAELTETIRLEGIRSLAFVPLVHGGELLGKFMVYFDEPHTLSPSELRLCRTMANHLGSSAARFRAQDQLRQSLALVNSLFRAAPTGLAHWDTDLRYVRVNDALTRINGLTSEEVAGRHVFDVFPAFEEQLAAPLRHVVEHGEAVLDLELEGETPAQPGAARFFRASFYPVRDEHGEPLGVGAIVGDVTAERTAQRTAEERAQAAEALEFIGDAVFLVDREQIVRLWNPAAEATFGIPASEAVGRPAEDVVAGFTGLDPRTHTVPRDVHGEERWLSVSSVAFSGGTVYAVRDTTEEQRVEQAKSDFIATVSHELRTPLAAVYGAAVTLRRPDLQLNPPERDRFLDMIVGETDRLARIVNDILWASRVEAGTLRLQIEPVDLAAVVSDVVTAARTYAPASVEVALDVADGLPPMRTDEDKLRQVLTNLVENAVKYSPDGGRVTLSVGPTGRGVRIAVSDEGLGIPPSDQHRIWEKFVRLDPNLARGVGGTGLGLYITRELVRRLRGTVGVRSDGHRGSVFTIELPGS